MRTSQRYIKAEATALLEKIGRLAIEHHVAQLNTTEAKSAYYLQCREFLDDRSLDRLADRDDPAFLRFTRKTYSKYLEAKAGEYNVKRRLATAIRNCHYPQR
ncbi:hypothetical protein [Paraburkholderia sp. DGU8]|uniref:hypothetical protein n=1 Tax=Paraburkholderia sp. DGU8 TaxID=3161997 RepID=UPI003465EB01